MQERFLHKLMVIQPPFQTPTRTNVAHRDAWNFVLPKVPGDITDDANKWEIR